MMKKQVLSGVLSLVMALTVFCIPVSGFAKDNSGTLKDADYPEMIAGGLTKEEVITMLEVTTVYLGGHKDEKSGKRKLETSCSSFLSEMENFPYNTMIYENVLYPMGVENEGIEKDGTYYNKLPLKDLNKCRAFWNLDPIDKNSKYDTNEIGWIDDKNVYYESWWKHTYTIESMEITQAEYEDNIVTINYDISWKNGTIGYSYEDGDNGRYTAFLGKNPDGKYALVDIIIGTPRYPRHDSGFMIGRDNNSFDHTRDVFYQKGSRNTIDPDYYKKLVKYATLPRRELVIWHMSGIKRQLEDDAFGGVCYGISATMALLYNDIVKDTDISDREASCYHDFGSPNSNERLRQYIFYYYLSQYLGDGGWKSAAFAHRHLLTGGIPTGDSLKEVLKEIVKQTSQNKNVNMFYYVPESSEGHTILTIGCTETSDKYVVQLYDMNGGDHGMETQPRLYISKDYEHFQMKRMGETIFDQDSYMTLIFIDPSKMVRPDGSLPFESTKTFRNSYIVAGGDSDYVITTDKGQLIHYKDGNITESEVSDIEVWPVAHAAGTTNKNEIVIEANDINEIKIEASGKQFYAGIANEEGGALLSGEDIDGAKLSVNDGITIKGEDYSFDATVTTGVTDNKDPIMVSMAADSQKTTTIQRTLNGQIALNTQGQVSNLQAKSLFGVEEVDAEVNTSGSTIIIDNHGQEGNYHPHGVLFGILHKIYQFFKNLFQ